MQIFVTGGTGLLGNTILRQLSERGHQSIALVRTDPAAAVFEGLDTQQVRGDLFDVAVIENAISQCDAVIHAAGVIHLGWTRNDESMRINRDGTRTIVDACIKHDRKIIHVGTVDTLAVGSKEVAASEETPLEHAGGQIPCDYVLSKRAGVEEVLAGVRRGLRAVIVHPGFMLGPWDWKPSSGRMMLEVGRAWRPLAPAGGCSLCDARDVAKTTIDAITRGGDSGRQFILAGTNLTYMQVWTEMADRMGSRRPVMRLGPLQRWIGGWGGDLWTKISQREGDVNSAAIKMSTQYHWHDSSRAIAELGYQIRDYQESLDASAEWVKTHHGGG